MLQFSSISLIENMVEVSCDRLTFFQTNFGEISVDILKSIVMN